MFLVTEKSMNGMFTVVDTDDGKIDIVSQEELKKAEQMGYDIKRDESMKSYTDFYKVCCKANVLGKLDDKEWHEKVLGLNLYN